MKTTLTNYLNKYKKFQKDIILVCRPTIYHGWKDRCVYLGEGYSPYKIYNHRIILNQEVVIEFDNEDEKINKKYADEVYRRMKKDSLIISKWYSGNKSYHVHVLFNINEITNTSAFKSIVIRHYCKDLPGADTQLIGNHLIRAEFGIHEKTGKHKKLISSVRGYPCLNEIPAHLLAWYNNSRLNSLLRKKEPNKDWFELPGFKYIYDGDKFKASEDGRERALFMLIHILKPKYEHKIDLIDFMLDWYKRAGGRKLTRGQIVGKVNYHWDKTYTITIRYLYNLLESIGYEEEMK